MLPKKNDRISLSRYKSLLDNKSFCHNAKAYDNLKSKNFELSAEKNIKEAFENFQGHKLNLTQEIINLSFLITDNGKPINSSPPKSVEAPCFQRDQNENKDLQGSSEFPQFLLYNSKSFFDSDDEIELELIKEAEKIEKTFLQTEELFEKATVNDAQEVNSELPKEPIIINLEEGKSLEYLNSNCITDNNNLEMEDDPDKEFIEIKEKLNSSFLVKTVDNIDSNDDNKVIFSTDSNYNLLNLQEKVNFLPENQIEKKNSPSVEQISTEFLFSTPLKAQTKEIIEAELLLKKIAESESRIAALKNSLEQENMNLKKLTDALKLLQDRK